MSIVIVDYGMGNLSSVRRALEEVGASASISGEADDILQADGLILPGVGAFGAGMENLNTNGAADALREAASERHTPLLGICLGMQLLASQGTEGGEHPGLDLIPGTVKLIEPRPDERLPHVGWNETHFDSPHSMFEGVESGTDFYFVHSYHFDCGHEHRIATTPYASGLTSAVARDHIWGAQFHPEKSSKSGLRLLENFVGSVGL